MEQSEKEYLIDEANELIGTFCGYKMYNKRYPRNHNIGGNILVLPKEMIIQKATFHKDWNSLMEAVETIEDLGYDVDIKLQSTAIYSTEDNCDIEAWNPNKKTATYQAVLKFIVWYNNNHPATGNR